MKSLLSLNVNAQATDLNRVRAFVTLGQPTTITVMDGLAFADELHRLLPGMITIHRDYAGYGGDDDLFSHLDPVQWVDQQTRKREIAGAMDIYAYADNEPPANQKTFDNAMRAAERALQTGLKLVLLNLGVGKPEDPDNGWNGAIPLLKLISSRKDKQLVLGGHEYFEAVCTSGFIGGNPDGTVQNEPGRIVHPDFIPVDNWPENPLSLGMLWHCGRSIVTLKKVCEKNGIPFPFPIILTEFGVDDVSDEGLKTWKAGLDNGKKLRSWRDHAGIWSRWFPQWSTEQAYWEQMKYLSEKLYAPAGVLGLNIFAFNRNWVHDITHATYLVNQLTYSQSTPIPQPPEPEPPKPEPEPPALPPIDLDEIVLMLEQAKVDLLSIVVRCDSAIEELSQSKAQLLSKVSKCDTIIDELKKSDEEKRK